MEAERWKQVEALCRAALELPPGERQAFLEKKAGDDEALRREVEELLAQTAEAALMDTPALEGAVRGLVEHKIGPSGQGEIETAQQSRSLIGQMLGEYRVIARLGTGGMSEVYLAEDTRLGRKAALKLLPEEFTADLERWRRFENEARILSALNNPNIVTIYGIGQVGPRQFLAMEFVEGRTLRNEIAMGSMALDIVL